MYKKSFLDGIVSDKMKIATTTPILKLVKTTSLVITTSILIKMVFKNNNNPGWRTSC